MMDQDFYLRLDSTREEKKITPILESQWILHVIYWHYPDRSHVCGDEETAIREMEIYMNREAVNCCWIEQKKVFTKWRSIMDE